MRTGSGVPNAVVWLVVLLWASPAGALPPDEPADQLKECVALTQDGRYEKALGVCLDALGEVPDNERSRIHKVLGFAYWKLNLLPESWHHLTSYLGSVKEENATVTGWLRKVEKKLKKKHVKITLACAGGMAVKPRAPGSGQSAAYACPVTWWFKPGAHEIRCEESGGESAPGTSKIAVKKVGDQGVRGVCGVTNPLSGGDPTPGRTLEWALIGSGTALTATGVVLQVLADSDDSSQGNWQGNAAYVLYGAGGAALVGGIVTWIVRKPARVAGNPFSLAVAPIVVPDTTGALISFAW